MLDNPAFNSMVAFFISNQFRPGNDLAIENSSFLVNGQKICVLFFVPGVARASQISNRSKTVDYYWCGRVNQSAALFTSCYPAKSGATSDI